MRRRSVRGMYRASISAARDSSARWACAAALCAIPFSWAAKQSISCSSIRPAGPIHACSSPDDTAFQHFAIVVSDMDLALAQLRGAPGWTPISIGGPQRLPQRSGGVTAFKFQDPDGHPLELLAFPEHAVPPHWTERSAYGIFLGIDHSAISVRDTAISTAFYQSLGFSRHRPDVQSRRGASESRWSTESAGRGHRPIPRGIDPASGIALLSVRDPSTSTGVVEQRRGGDAHRVGH